MAGDKGLYTHSAMTGSLTCENGFSIQTDTNAGDAFYWKAYDTDGGSYTTFATLTAGTSPSLDFTNATINGSAPVGSDSPTFTTNVTLTGGGVWDADGMDLTTGNDYQINNVSVLSATALGSSVVSSSLASFGVVTSGTLSTGAVVGGVTLTLGSDASFDTYYRGATGVLTRLAPNTAATNKFYRMVGTGVAGQAPSWETLVAGDIPDLSATYQPLDDDLTTIAGLSSADSNFIVGSATGWVVESGATARTSLGLGALATLSTINNGYWSGTDLSVANGGTGASDTATARTNLGLAIGSDVQAYDADLSAIGALAKTDGNFIVGNGTTWVAESGATVRTSLGLGSLATLSTVNNAYWSGTDLSVGNGGTGASDAGTARTNLGVAIGSDVQAFSQNLADIAALTDPNDDRIIFWDDTAGAHVYLDLGTNLSITGTTLNASTSGISDVVDDTTPQLGGNLDVNGNSIVSASNGDIAIAPNGTGDFHVNTNDLYVDTSTGYVGVSTTAPLDKFVVGTNFSFGLDGSTSYISKGNVSVSSSNYFIGNDGLTTYINATGAIRLRQSNSDKAILKNGNWGVGTTNPTSILHIKDGHFTSEQTTAPTSTLTTTTLNDGGGSGAAITVTTGSTDMAGSFTVTAGNGTPGAGIAGQIVFNSAFTAAPKSVVFTSKDADGVDNQIYCSATSTTNFTISFNSALSASEAVEFYYIVIE